jgi:hypothetical protein
VSITNGASSPAFPAHPDVAIHRMMDNALDAALKASSSNTLLPDGIPEDAHRCLMWVRRGADTWECEKVWLKDVEETLKETEQITFL